MKYQTNITRRKGQSSIAAETQTQHQKRKFQGNSKWGPEIKPAKDQYLSCKDYKGKRMNSNR